MNKSVVMVEVALRDGSHVVKHQFSKQQVIDVVTRLDKAKMPYIEVGHGDGLGGSTIQYGFSLVDEYKLIEAAVNTVTHSKITVLALPGIATKANIKKAAELGVEMVRVATHASSADLASSYLSFSKEVGLKAGGFLMMSHSVDVKTIVEQAIKLEHAGADLIYIVDSAGAMVPNDVAARVKAVSENVAIPIGFHGHNNLSLAIANSIEAIKYGATYLDSSIGCLGAGAGNTQTEVLATVLDKLNIDTNVDFYELMDIAEENVGGILKSPQQITKSSLLLGYLGVYSSFLPHVQSAAKQYNVDERSILIELEKRKAVGGQEDVILDIVRHLKSLGEG